MNKTTYLNSIYLRIQKYIFLVEILMWNGININLKHINIILCTYILYTLGK